VIWVEKSLTFKLSGRPQFPGLIKHRAAGVSTPRVLQYLPNAGAIWQMTIEWPRRETDNPACLEDLILMGTLGPQVMPLLKN
jgi:hypothetical protein